MPLESVWSELLKKDQSGHPNLWKAPNYDVHQIWPSRKLVSNYILKKQWLRLSLRTIEYATNTYKKYFYTFRINKITFTNSERRKELLNFYGMFGKNLPISAAFITILNAIGVRTPPDSQMSGKCISGNQPFYLCEVLEFIIWIFK